MFKRRRSKISPARLRDAYKADLAEAWNYARKRHPSHTPYAFALYGVEGHVRLSPNVLTEEGLSQVARRYVELGHHATLDEAREALRFSVADSPHIAELENHLPTVDALVEPMHADEIDEATGYALLAKAAMDAMAELDEQGLFGAGTDRERMLLIIITEDAEKDWSLPSAKRLNSKAVFQRFKDATDIEGEFASSDALAVAPDGLMLYSTGSRSNPKYKSGSNNEFIVPSYR